MKSFEVGKLPHAVLERMIGKIDVEDSRVVLGPGIGEDAAVIDMGDRYLVATTDPITFAQERIGWYCVNVNANDVATMGARPRWFFATLLLPEGKARQPLVDAILDDILRSCRDLGMALCGGHTEITTGLDRPILVGHLLGEVAKNKLVSSDRIAPGDVILLTHGIAIEGTAILAAEKEEELEGRVDRGIVARSKEFLANPGISVVRAAMTACEATRVHGMHDPTEGGLATGLWEMAKASGMGAWIEGDAVFVYPETQALCEALDLDPWGLIASGALLIVVAAEDSEKVISALKAEDIPCRPIGQILASGDESVIVRQGRTVPLKPFERDELARIA